jgi:murein DD-endopeptidase MepM/ murein hydrolase activator NlpD
VPPTATAAPPAPTAPQPSATPAEVIVAATLTPAPAEPAATGVPAVAEPGELRYFFPVQGARVSYGASHHDYPATDIFCPEGSLFVAPTDGVIDFVSYTDEWSPASDEPSIRGGISVAMIGDDGVRYYGSHLSTVAEGIVVGARVAAGQTLGLTGKSGNARSTPPHLHFGISRPTTADDWAARRGEVPPYPYLQAWAAGESVTPQLP